MGLLDGEMGIAAWALWDERLLAVLPFGHTLAGTSSIRWADLSREPVIVRTWENDGEMLNFVIGKLAIRGHSPDLVQHRIGRESLLDLVGVGYGVTLVAESAAAVGYPGVVFHPIAEDDARITASAVWLAENGNPAARRLVSLLRRAASTGVDSRGRSPSELGRSHDRSG
ncbi:MAG: hypothetical protein GC191_18205 [Azospirillum sp.]|nr:hypothetical protein [Azospirillum sp.]